MTRYWLNILIILTVAYSSGALNIDSEQNLTAKLDYQLDQNACNDSQPFDSDQDSSVAPRFPTSQFSDIEAIQKQDNSVLVSVATILHIRGPPYLYS